MCRKVATLCVVALLALAGSSAARSDHGKELSRVAVATTKHPSEVRATVPITRHGPGKGRVVMSMNPNRLPDLRLGDRLTAFADVQVTMDCYRELPRCAGRPYHFNPVVEGRVELARSRRPGGPGAVTIAHRKLTCLQHQPARQHHCPLVFATDPAEIRHGLPCPPRHCFVNVVVSAHSRAARGGEVVVIGANKPNGRIVQGKGEVSVLRVRPPSPPPRALRTDRPRRGSLPLNAQRHVILSRRIGGLERGDKLSVIARLRSGVKHLGYNALVGAQLVLARSPGATRPSRLVRRAVSRGGALSQLSGTNCTPVKSPCGTAKVGVASIRRNPIGRSGAPVALFANLVVRTKQKQVERQRRARLRIRDGELTVRAYGDS
jgi:hypothetical protein